jgi:putative ABC transport system permease protein
MCSVLVALASRLRVFLHRRRIDDDAMRECEAHIELLTERYVRAGLTLEEARTAARRRFGSATLVREEIYRMNRIGWIERLAQDVRYALRGMRRSPTFTLVAILILALGIAGNAAMFSLVSAFLLHRPQVLEPDRVVVITSVNPASGYLADASPVSAPNYLAWRDANRVFADLAAASEGRTVSLRAQEPEAVRSSAVSPNYFSVLGVSPLVGRTFSAGEDQPGHDHVVILSHDLWQRSFGSDPAILGRTVRLNREDYDVVGVMPTDFRLLGFTDKLWTPLVLSAADQRATARNARSLYLFARLKPGVTVAYARADVVALARRAEDAFPESEKGWGAAVRTLPDFLVHDFDVISALAVLMTAVGFVLLIACANVAGLLLARATGRQKELAIRIALGAGRGRIIGQLLIEVLVLTLLGGCAGLLLSSWGIDVIRANMTFNDAISAVSFRLDRNVLLFALGVSLLCAVLCAVAPALNAVRTEPNASLKDESRASSASRSQSRLRAALVTGQIALALFLLVGTGLLLRGLFLIDHQSLGFQADRLLTAVVNLDDAHYKNAAQRIAFVEDVLRRLEQIPGAEAAAVASDLPATGAGEAAIRFKGEPERQGGQQRTAIDVVVSPDYFRAAGIPLLRGRTFRVADDARAPRVVVVNEEFVHRNLPNQDPLGMLIGVNPRSETALEWSEIVGVVGNVKTYSEDVRVDPEVYEALWQRPVPALALMVRAGADSNGLASALRNAVTLVDAELPLSRLESMHTVIENQKGGSPFFSRALACFALLALVLAAVGIYGLVAYSVGQRTHEIGVRMALGASRTDVLALIVWQGVRMTGIGAAVGLATALPLPRILDAIFYGLHVREPRLYVFVPLAIFVVTMFAAIIPARRALAVDPIAALRHE